MSDRNRLWLNMNDGVETERQFLQLWAAVSEHLSPKRRGEIIKTIFMSGLERVGHLYGLDMRQMTVDLDLVHETLKLDKNGRKKRVRTKPDIVVKKARKTAEKPIVVAKAPETTELYNTDIKQHNNQSKKDKADKADKADKGSDRVPDKEHTVHNTTVNLHDIVSEKTNSVPPKKKLLEMF